MEEDPFSPKQLVLTSLLPCIPQNHWECASFYQEVVTQGARGLTIKGDPADLHLIVSGGLVMDDTLQDGKPWTIGGHVQEIGGVSARWDLHSFRCGGEESYNLSVIVAVVVLHQLHIQTCTAQIVHKLYCNVSMML